MLFRSVLDIAGSKKQGYPTVYADDDSTSSNSDEAGVAIPILQTKSPSAKSKVESWRATLMIAEHPSDHGIEGDHEAAETDSGYEPDSPWTPDAREEWTPDEDEESDGNGGSMWQSLRREMSKATLEDADDAVAEECWRKVIQDALQ